MLQDFDSLLDDRVRFEIPYALHLEIEPLRDGVVVKRLAFLWRLFPISIFTFWPFQDALVTFI